MAGLDAHGAVSQYIIGTMLITGPFVLMTVVVYLIHVLSIAGGENQN